jgi:Kef-type K+ transport system membrane component KefB
MLVEIGVALLLAKLLGHLFEKMKQPAVIGEILSGILIGPFILGRFFDIDFLSIEIEGVAKLGIVFLLFISGLEISIGELKSAGRCGIWTAFFGALLSFFCGYLVGYFMGYSLLVSIAIGNIFVATSVGVSVRTLMELGTLHSHSGQVILTAAVIDDVIGIIILSVTLGQGEMGMSFLKILLFFGIFFAAFYFFHKIRGVKLHIPRLMLTAGIALAFLFSALAKSLGLAMVIGAFFAGLLVSNFPQKKRIRGFTRQIGEVFFIPLFFVWVGASFDFHALDDIGVFVGVFIALALIGKLVGSMVGARISGMRLRESLVVGIGMMPRLEIALVVVSTEVAREIFDEPLAHQVMAGTILLVIISTFLTPLLLKLVHHKTIKTHKKIT